MKGGRNSVQVKHGVFFMTYSVHLLNHKLSANSLIQVWLGTKASSQNLPQYLEGRLPAGKLAEVTASGLGGSLVGESASPAACHGCSGTT